MKKLNFVEIVNRKYLHPRNIIAAFTDKLTHQQGFGEGLSTNMDIGSSTGFDPAGESDQSGFAIPPVIYNVIDGEGIGPGITVEEQLTLTDGVYMTSLPFDFMRNVWFDGLLALPTVHWTVSGSDGIVTYIPLISGSQVIAQYVVGLD